MSATGNEIVNLRQLKMYVKYASDEDVEGYIAPPFEGGNIEVSSDLIYTDSIDVVVSDDGEVSISGYIQVRESINLISNTEMFSIPSDYAPNKDIQFSVDGYYEAYHFILDTNGTVKSTSSHGYLDAGYTLGKFTNVTYTIDIPQSTLDGTQVVRLSQVKKYFNGSGSGGSGSWQTIWTGAESSDTDVHILLSPINQNQYTKIAITCEVESYSQGQDSGRYELVIANLPTEPTRFDEDSSFICAGYGFMVAIVFGDSNEALLTISSPSPYDTYITVTKIEVQ